MVRRLAPRVYEGGATSSQTGGGGSPSPAYLSQKSVKNRTVNTARSFFTFCCREFVLPPVPVCATLTTPLTSAGGKDAYRIHPHTIQQTALQIPICRDTERYRAGQAGNENRPRSSRLVSGDSPPNSNLSACWGEAKCIFQNQTCRRALAFRQVLAFSGAGYSLLIRSSSASSWDRDSIS